ncbi:MAG TPA: N-acyl homoserine lactonase family protein [Solirubrobacteraceae bacterium]|jgi:glyoxylase-like metal-dependent hydrolase (beta-lactamase superfamily II)
MKIHAIQTGTVAIKTRQVEGRGRGARRQLNMFLDREWTEPLPIYAFAIEHPEGVIVVDTGETARTSESDYFPRGHPFFRFGLREWVAPDEEIGPQLQRLGIQPGDVRSVVLTHLHTDHAGGLHHFPHNEILVSRADLEVASGLRGRLRGYPNKRFPRWFDPTVVELSSGPYGPFPESLRLTEAGDVVIVPLPGHTSGQLGVVVEDGDHIVLLAGDASYTEELMLRGVVDGPSPDDATAQLTHERIRALAEQTPTVYLVAHDPETAARLAGRRVVGDAPLKAAA